MDVLLDTGPWVAMIDRSEKKHKICIKWLKNFSGRMFSTEAVLTEVLYLLNFSYDAQAGAMDFVLTGAVTVMPSSVESIKAAKQLMLKYRDIPMDFADASLVVLANDLSISNIVTFDVRDFSIYRTAAKGHYTIIPGA